MDQKIVNKKYCSYRCKYYQDGAVLSLCNKFKAQLKYLNGKPLALEECVSDVIGRLDKCTEPLPQADQ